jgi:NAD+ synthase
MPTQQTQIIKTLKTKPAIRNPELDLQARINFLKTQLVKSKTKGFVIGMSGGADSALVGWIAAKAIQELNTEHKNTYTLHTIILPYDEQKDLHEAVTIVNEYVHPTKNWVINIRPATDALITEYETVTRTTVPDFHKGNMKARQRMVTLYLHAATYNLLVVGTDNAAEQATGFYTKHGDGAYDLNPIQTLTKNQVMELLAYTNAPEFIQTKIPAADLQDKNATSDEQALGVTYKHLDGYLQGETIPTATQTRIETLYAVSGHKRDRPPFL